MEHEIVGGYQGDVSHSCCVTKFVPRIWDASLYSFSPFFSLCFTMPLKGMHVPVNDRYSNLHTHSLLTCAKRYFIPICTHSLSLLGVVSREDTGEVLVIQDRFKVRWLPSDNPQLTKEGPHSRLQCGSSRGDSQIMLKISVRA